MSRLNLHVLYEHGADGEPFGSAHARLLRPLSHPAIGHRVQATFGHDYDGQRVDALVIDRLWRPDVTAARVQRLLDRARRAGALVIHALDDNFPDLIDERPDWATPDQAEALGALLAGVDGFLVTTVPLAERYGAYNANIAVVPNALDERLLNVRRHRRALKRLVPRRGRPITIGYMGTFTHTEDLAMIAPALRHAHERFGDGVRVQLVGVSSDVSSLGALADVPLEAVPPTPDLAVYPVFMPWFLNTFRWDIALSPLRLTPFSRGKSDIKHLDYAALGAAGVFSRHPAYAGTVRHGDSGWLADDNEASWSHAIETLVTDGSVRRRLARGARRYLYAQRTLKQTAHLWPDAIERLLAAAGQADGCVSDGVVSDGQTRAEATHGASPAKEVPS